MKYTLHLLIAEDGQVWEAPVLTRIEATGRSRKQIITLLKESRKSFEQAVAPTKPIKENVNE